MDANNEKMNSVIHFSTSDYAVASSSHNAGTAYMVCPNTGLSGAGRITNLCAFITRSAVTASDMDANANDASYHGDLA